MPQVLPWVIALGFLLVMPLIFTSNSALTIMNQMAMTIIFALAYNMLLGQGGMLSFGHAVYMGVGGFACVHIMNWDAFFGLIPLPVLPIFGGLFGMGLALIVGAFSTRKAGTVFAMISLGVGELIAACSSSSLSSSAVKRASAATGPMACLSSASNSCARSRSIIWSSSG